MPKSVQLKPYAITEGIALHISDPYDPTSEDLDLHWEEKGEDDDQQLRLDLRGNGQWRELHFGIEARLEPSKLESVLPKGADYRTDTALIVSVRCPATKSRYPIRLEADPKEAGLWAGDVHFLRRDVRSRLEFHPALCRTSDIPSSATIREGISRNRNALLGTGRSFVVAVDYVQKNYPGPVRIRWSDFRHSKDSWRSQHKDSLYYLDLDPSEPVLWLNSGTPRMRALLLDRSENTVDSGLRIMLSTWLAETVWMQLFNAALGSIATPASDEGAVLPEGWRGDVLRQYLRIMFPEHINDVSSALNQAVSMRESEDEVYALTGLATTATQETVSTQKQFLTAIRSVEKGS